MSPAVIGSNERSITGILYPNKVLAEPWLENAQPGLDGKSGSTEPWTQQFLWSLILAARPRLILETGSYLGHTTGWLACALQQLDGGTLHVVEVDPIRLLTTQTFLERIDFPDVMVSYHCKDARAVIAGFPPNTIEFAWVDDNHDPKHVAQEFDLLIPRMARRGIIAFHDVYGEFDLQKVVKKRGGFCLDFPRLHNGGGVGLWQKAAR